MIALPRDEPLRWDIYGRVVDHLGDVGVCWRLAAELAARGDRVRLVMDDPTALAWMAPQGCPGVEILRWPGPVGPDGEAPGDVVVETFGCDLPPPARAAQAAAVAASRAGGAPPAPPWIDVEHLSAEPFVQRSHGLPSPQADGCVRWFFFPGFTADTGGLLREADLTARRAAFDPVAWRTRHRIAPRPGERVLLLFAYDTAPLAPALPVLGRAPTLLLVPPGPPARLVEIAREAAGPAGWPEALRVQPLPWLPQRDFDALLWSCDAAFVRGEDSLVRALWAGVPFVWQAYVQHDGAHHAKVEALLSRWDLPPAEAAWWRFWNRMPGFEAAGPPPLPPPLAWAAAAQARAVAAAAGPELVERLRAFALARRGARPA